MPADWNISLPDLKSRLATAQIILLDQPDDELAEQLMLKLFRDRGTSIGIDALAYALRRIERSYAGIEAFVRRANQFSLSEGGALTLPRVKRLLETER
jgi:chromosomal replication initiation ATPase DnaA